MLPFPLGGEAWIDRFLERLFHDRETVKRDIDSTHFRRRFRQTTDQEQTEEQSAEYKEGKAGRCSMPQRINLLIRAEYETAAINNRLLAGVYSVYTIG